MCAEFGSSRDAQFMDINLRNMRNIIEKCHGFTLLYLDYLQIAHINVLDHQQCLRLYTNVFRSFVNFLKYM